MLISLDNLGKPFLTWKIYDNVEGHCEQCQRTMSKNIVF